ncbi:MAG: serine/threonine-protein kinase [Planctomycetota bacterium]
MEEPADPPPTLAAELEQRIDADGSDPWRALLELVARPGTTDASAAFGLQGRSAGDVRLLRILGTGGMGVTYLGEDAANERVAVKVFGHLDEAAQIRFENECRILRTLDHAHIVRYRTHGVSPEFGAFLVMDYIEGTDLDRLLAALTTGEALDDIGESLTAGIDQTSSVFATASYRRRIVRLLAAIADALACAHDAGIVHRDVKPANIIVRADLSPVLIDFGLGRDLFRELSWTRSGAVVGTVGWMAPEQLDGNLDAIGPRTDVFALGLVLHTALTGRELRKNLRDLGRYRRGPLRLDASDRAGLDAAMLGILYGCLEPEPRRRYATAGAVAVDLRSWLSDGTVSRRAPGPIRRALRDPKGRASAMILAAVALSLIAWLVWPQYSLISIMGLEDDQNGSLTYSDGSRIPLLLPVVDWRVPRGSVFDLRYTSPRLPGVEIPIRIVADREFVRENVLHRVPELDELGPEQGTVIDPDTGLLDLMTRVDLPPQECLVDGVSYRMLSMGRDKPLLGPGYPQPHWRARIRLPSGPHSVVLVDNGGQRTTTSVFIERERIESCALRLGRLRDVEGDVRMEWANVLATPPPGLSFELGGVADKFLDGPAQVREQPEPGRGLQTGYIYQERNTTFAPLAADREAWVELRIRFPHRVRSVFAALAVHCEDHHGSTMRLRWKVDDQEWHECLDAIVDPVNPRTQYTLNGVDGFGVNSDCPIELHGLPAPGISELRIRCDMVATQALPYAAFVRFLTAYANSLFGLEPCFQLVADRSEEKRVPK